MKTIYLTRHGQTDWNVKKRFQGRTDICINETGKYQAQCLNEQIKNYPIDICYTSPSSRAYITAKIAVDGQNIPVVTDDRLLEMKLGDWEGCSYEEIYTKFGQDAKDFWYNPGIFKRDGIESFQDIIDRTSLFSKEIYNGNEEHILVVTHGITARALISPWDNRNVDNFWLGDKVIGHCTINIIQLEKDFKGKILLWGNQKLFTVIKCASDTDDKPTA